MVFIYAVISMLGVSVKAIVVVVVLLLVLFGTFFTEKDPPCAKLVPQHHGGVSKILHASAVYGWSSCPSNNPKELLEKH
jgi:hypothetical protein